MADVIVDPSPVMNDIDELKISDSEPTDLNNNNDEIENGGDDNDNMKEEEIADKINNEQEIEQKVESNISLIKENGHIINNVVANGNQNLPIEALLPEKLTMVPIEHEIPLTPSDAEFIKTLSQKYNKQLTTTFSHQPELILRFVLGYAHEKPKKRMAITCERLEKYMKTYEELKLNGIVQSNVIEDEYTVMKSWAMYIYGMDKMGHPIMYDHLGALDLIKLQEIYTRNPEIIKLTKYRFMTKLTNFKSYLSNKYGKLIYKHVMIFDMKGFTKRFMGTTSRKLCKEMIGDLTQIYPEMAYKVFVINAPAVFKNCWKIVKTFMEPVTAEKVKVFSAVDLKEFYKELALIADPEMIPPVYGGKGFFTIRLSDIPAEFNVDLSKSYPYELPQFPIKQEEKSKKITKK